MPTDFELFLFNEAVVEIKNQRDLFRFFNIMDKVGFSKYINNLRKIESKDGIFDLAHFNNVYNLCLEYQYAKGFTFADRKEYEKYSTEDAPIKILSVTDLIKSVSKTEEKVL